MRILLDTNVLGRLANTSDPDHQLAENAVAAIRGGGYLPCIVPQDIFEFWVVATRPKENNGFGLSAPEAQERVSKFKSVFLFCDDSPRIFEEWEKTVSTYGVVGKNAHDARFVAAAIVHGIAHFLTINTQDFRRYREITVLSLSDALQLNSPK